MLYTSEGKWIWECVGKPNECTETTLDELYEKKEFRSMLSYDDNLCHEVSEGINNTLNIGCNNIKVKDIKKLLKEYEDFKK